MNRAEYQQLAEERLLAAKTLLDAGYGPTAYYIAGYAVELGLKACVLMHLAASPEVIFDPPRNKFAESCWTHRIKDLLGLAGLEPQLAAEVGVNGALHVNWQTVFAWTEGSRYQWCSDVEAWDLYNAIHDPKNGVMQWLRQRW